MLKVIVRGQEQKKANRKRKDLGQRFARKKKLLHIKIKKKDTN